MRNDRLLVETLINKMFEIAGHSVTFNDILSREDDWYCQWTMTEDQNKEWREWGIKHLRKDGKMFKTLAEREMAMINLSYGLKIENS
tara:strand:- start:394 stop:654 length:261 start_codon:yes stop_codon:yes gene_type:complete